MKRCSALMVTAVFVALVVPARGENVPGGWEQVPQEERQLLQPYRDRWDTLSPERRERLRRGEAS